MEKQILEEKEILHWIVDHADDTELMERINKLTFPFTTYYRQRYSDDRKLRSGYAYDDVV